jgi:hypothetical protein
VEIDIPGIGQDNIPTYKGFSKSKRIKNLKSKIYSKISQVSKLYSQATGYILVKFKSISSLVGDRNVMSRFKFLKNFSDRIFKSIKDNLIKTYNYIKDLCYRIFN